MSNACSRVSSQKLMSGEWQYHMSIIHTVFPTGLHRLFYEVSFKDGGLVSVPVKHRVNRMFTDKKNLWMDLRCAYV